MIFFRMSSTKIAEKSSLTCYCKLSSSERLPGVPTVTMRGRKINRKSGLMTLAMYVSTVCIKEPREGKLND